MGIARGQRGRLLNAWRSPGEPAEAHPATIGVTIDPWLGPLGFCRGGEVVAVLASKEVLLDLAGGGAWEFVDEDHRLWHLEAGEGAAGRGEDVGLGES